MKHVLFILLITAHAQAKEPNHSKVIGITHAEVVRDMVHEAKFMSCESIVNMILDTAETLTANDQQRILGKCDTQGDN